jgi:hypothetical protein
MLVSETHDYIEWTSLHCDDGHNKFAQSPFGDASIRPHLPASYLCGYPMYRPPLVHSRGLIYSRKQLQQSGGTLEDLDDVALLVAGHCARRPNKHAY